jgi:hypothetical protein
MRSTATVFFMLAFVWQASAQKKLNLGIGYFGQTFTHPGLVANLELEKQQSTKVATLSRLDLGTYLHQRNHLGVFVDAHFGLRRYRKSGFFTEQYLGIGTLLSFYEGDGVFAKDENGKLRRISSFANPDLMPSVTLGAGYKFKGEQGPMIYFRPKVYWQLPYNNLALPHLAVQTGVVWNLR